MICRKENKKIGSECQLIDRTKLQVRFSEVDSMRIVWHGEYLRYFEDGRESFGRKFGLTYLDVYNAGFRMPMVKVECEYKAPLTIDDIAIVETRFVNHEAAKAIFDYAIFREKDMRLCATGRSIQVFLDENNELVLSNPEFIIEWKKKWNIAI